MFSCVSVEFTCTSVSSFWELCPDPHGGVLSAGYFCPSGTTGCRLHSNFWPCSC